MLVSDFGLARRLEQDQSSFAPTANNLAGSLGWRAPECIRGHVRLHLPDGAGGSFDGVDPAYSSSSSSTSSLPDLGQGQGDETGTGDGKGKPKHARLTKAVDLFALGCLYFWVLMSGQHPFGEVYDRESNIVRGDAVNMTSLDILGEEGVEARALIGAMLSVDPDLR
jgi:serine/threonine-protein kinase/endoribonuclease IRE1